MPDIKIVMSADQVEWIRSRAGGQMMVEPRPSPHRAKPIFAYGLTIAHAYVAAAMVTFPLASFVCRIETAPRGGLAKCWLGDVAGTDRSGQPAAVGFGPFATPPNERCVARRSAIPPGDIGGSSFW